MIKKTCNGCYAADTGRHPKFGQPYGCTLGYQTDGHGHPKEECPKPKSWKQLKNIEKERAIRTCENCKYAALAGGDYDPAMGGGYTPVTVDECQHPSVTVDDMDSAIEMGIDGRCRRENMPPEDTVKIMDCFLCLPNGEKVTLNHRTEELLVQTVEEGHRPVIPKNFGCTLEVKMRHVRRPRQRMINRALKMMGVTEARRQFMNHLHKAKLQKEPVNMKIMTEAMTTVVDILLEAL